MKAQLIFLELFTFLHDIFWRVKICLDINFHEERIFGTLVNVNRLLILIESCSASNNLFEYWFSRRAYFEHFSQSKSTSYIN
ncbi:uncharacterized protein OCT59_023615 [Rhizophagus irregularis]|uniref:uncharacterized protein n=1 Tax=Rhizophagus irregularis TaxID=588596 RepID=UPI0033274F8B|nr:hypothetical protein OCT59_023615 [Rhizophagus irregularis]